MPKLPRLLADAMESLFSSMMHPVTVEKIDYLYPYFKKVVFKGDTLKSTKYQPGWEIEFRVNGTDFRHYTPSFYDIENGICEVLFYLHNQGPGSEWARTLQPGDKTKLLGPGKKIELDKTWQHYVFLGDETTVGLFCELQRGLNPTQTVSGAIEASPHLNGLAEASRLRLDTLIREKKPGDALIQWLQRKDFSDSQDTIFYVAGHGQSIQQLRNLLRQKGVSSKQIVTRPYWADGKKGL